ncbi:MAG: class II D-tagatose-bisphosphate aldolase, non-catalytic subunit [Bryobacteraceae bacterium]|nr:class II D-tagatose-bisphosphate aldolase, non-catalytic subunit [Bryobacterales bacterium]NUN03301.1 class II D-tagatose-bisphosphate aldolase, non-catalytic subunit [Bryobacteraceae bacterium]
MIRPNAHSIESLETLIQRNRRGKGGGITSVCSANPQVLEAAAREAAGAGTILCVESTSNQVNQFGGYTGLKPAGFVALVRNITERAGLAREQLLLGGDHLGPYPWRKEPAASAMEKACELVRLCVAAGYSKIHADASMNCAGDPAGPLDEKVIAERSALLAKAAEEAHSDVSGGPAPRYIVGTEVPVPGGEQAAGEPPSVTRPQDVARTIELARSAFAGQGLQDAWSRVIGLVVQPGVEFGDAVVFDYDPGKTRELVAALPPDPQLSYEAHSTDYQTGGALRRMVLDHFAILKVGPWLTFAFREAVFALSAVEREWLGGRRGAAVSQVREALEQAMLQNPEYWRPYYTGSDEDLRFARAFSYSDRCRYYWPQPAVQAELEKLWNNLTTSTPPSTLLSQYLPAEYEAVRAGTIANEPKALVQERVRRVLRTYAAACEPVGQSSD